ncbi:HAMP domain-containing sensor histidine kinase [Pelomonas sp. SE-A7]|uniref:sensor histidine kinase n=1 Tax=Pelomonas sp. SE-A7 TaxID=3054953 RepID=UPI00259C8EFB|nr:HAMP domain-containing sensor histidine kinase [Pelomonas sp. SE-A7]MDM4765694.1 HAMP domain-containing sensor histidine kinase [Pelomonas sp. SE-A7]
MRASALWARARQPSLMRRIFAALLLAYLLVALVLLANDYRDLKSRFEEDLAIKLRAESMAPILAKLSDERQAGLVVAAITELFNTRRASMGNEGQVIHQLRRADGSVVMEAPAGRRLAFESAPGQIVHTRIDGKAFWTVEVAAGPWRLAIAEPSSSDWRILEVLAVEILDKMLLVFPLVLLPLWLAVRSGVAPLLHLARTLAARAPDDLSPLGVATPHAELRPLVAAFEQLLARLRRKVQLERAFVQDAAHEMRTPMAAIAAQSHVLARSRDEAERQAAEAALAQMLERAAHLNQQLLELAALDDGTAPGARSSDLVQLIEQTLALAHPQAASRGLELSLEAPERLLCELDLPAFQSVLQNLLDNALRYVPEGGRIVVSLAEQGPGWHLSVADDGPGIAVEARERAFDRFWRGEHAGVRGSGLGLAIARQAARRLGGRLEIEDGLARPGGCGAAFVLSVPR